MKEFVELRLLEEAADALLPPGVGKRLTTGIHLVQLARTDPLLDLVLTHDRALQERSGGFAFLGWQIHRSYSERELSEAELLLVGIRRVFEPTGEDCDTEYDDMEACMTCGDGGKQVGTLRLQPSSIPRGVDFAMTIGGEIVVSERAVECLRDAGMVGGRFFPILAGKRGERNVPGWQQLDLSGGTARASDPTCMGDRARAEGPLDRTRCSVCGQYIGNRLLTELSVDRGTVANVDIQCSADTVGIRRGMLRPRPLLLFTPRVRQILRSKAMSGCTYEVVHLT